MNLNLQTIVCDPERLEAFLCGDLTGAQESEFSLHLSTCENCRRALQERAAEPEAWQEAEKLLRPAEFDVETDNLVLSQPLQIQQVVAALGPTDDPAMLGRLGGYEVSGVVGAGGMGVVLKAIDKSLDRTVAIKVLAPHLATSGAARKRFAREAKAAAAVLHPNVIAIHSVSNEQSLPYLVMPYVRGTSLQKRLDAEGPLSLQEILRIGAQVAAGLAAAHAQGLVHRDIKPANILLEEGVERVTITDFGLARAVDDASITHSGMIAGTPQYMSPEQARGEAVDGRSDLFSLGSVLYAICTGRPPFRAETSYGVMRRITDDEPTSIREINPEIPAWLCHIVTRLMSKRPDSRFASAAEVSELFEKCLAHVQQPASAPLPAWLLANTERRFSFPSRLSQGVIAVIAAIGLGIVGLFLWQASEAPDIAGKWSGPDWGEVLLKQKEPGEYEGTYTDTFKQKPGKIQLKWSRLEGRYKGTWQEGKERRGKISVRLVDGEIRGAWTASEKSGINPGNPELADLLWKRSGDKDELPKKTDAQPPLNVKSDKELLQGFWSLQESYSEGKKVGDDAPRSFWLHELWIHDNECTELFTFNGKRNGGQMGGTLLLDQIQKPKQITIVSFGSERRGIYKLDGDTLTICWAEVKNGGAGKDTVRPDEFRTFPDSARLLHIYKLKKQVLVDLYDVLKIKGDFRENLGKPLNALPKVLVSYHDSRKPDSPPMAVIRDPYKICEQDPTLKAAINDALRAGGIKAVRWEEADFGSVSGHTRQPAKLQGTVTDVKDQELLEISLGADDGLRARDVLSVFRDNTYLGKITVTRVAADKSVARIEASQGDIRRGDQVAIESSEQSSKTNPTLELQSLIDAAKQFNDSTAQVRKELFTPPIPDLKVERLRDGFRQSADLYRRQGKRQVADALLRIAESGRVPKEASGLIGTGVHAQDDDGQTISRQIVPGLILPDDTTSTGYLLVVLRPLELMYRKDGPVSKDYGDLFDGEKGLQPGDKTPVKADANELKAELVMNLGFERNGLGSATSVSPVLLQTGKIVLASEFKAYLEKEKLSLTRQHGDAAANTTIRLNVDRDVQFDAVTALMKLCQEVGFQKFALRLADEAVEKYVLEILRTPFDFDPAKGSWQDGAFEMQVLLSLNMVQPRDRVVKTLLKVVDRSEKGTMDQRRLAMMSLGGMAPRQVIPLLIKELEGATDLPVGQFKTSFPYHEIAVLEQIGEEAKDAIEEGKSAIPILIKLLDSPDGLARQSALFALVKIGPSSDEVMNAIAARFGKPDEPVWSRAVYEVGRYGTQAKPLGPTFVKLLSAKPKEARIWAAQALVKSGFDEALGFETLIGDVAKGEPQDRGLAATALAALGSQAKPMIPKLRAFENDPDAHVAKEVRDAIRRIEKDDRIFTHAEEAAKNAASRTASAAALEKLSEETKAILSETEYQRFEGTWRISLRTVDRAVALGEFGKDGKHVIKDRQMGDALILLDPSKTPREIDLTFTSGPDKGKVLRGIYEWVDHPKTGKLLRISVSTKLNEPSDDASHRPKDFEARAGVDFAIWERIVAGHPQGGASRDPVGSTGDVELPKDEANRIVEQMRGISMQLAPGPRSDGKPDPKEERKQEIMDQLRQLGAKAVPALVLALGDSDVQMRRNAELVMIHLAGPYGKPRVDIKEALPALLKATEDPDADVRAWAAHAIAEIGPGAKEAVPALIKLLQGKDEGGRNTSCMALGAIGPAAKDALPALRKALDDPSQDVRKFAEAAIKRIVLSADAKAAEGQMGITDPNSAAKPKWARHLGTVAGLKSIAYSPDGKFIAAANGNVSFPVAEGWKRAVVILDAETGNTVLSLPLATKEENAILAATEGLPHFEVGPLAFSPDGTLLAVGTGLGQVKLINPKTGELVGSLDDEKAKLDEKTTPEKLKSLRRAMGGVGSLAFSPDGSLLAMTGSSFEDVARNWGGVQRLGRLGTGPGRLKVWDVKAGTIKHDLAGHSHVEAVSFSADGNLLASAGRWADANDDGNGVIIWNSQTGKTTSKIVIEANSGTHAVVFSPTNKLVAIGSRHYDKENDTYTTSVRTAYALSGITEWSQTIPGWANPKSFSPDGKSVLTLCNGESIRFIKTETGEVQHEIKVAGFLPANPRQGKQWNDFAIAPLGHQLAIVGVDKERIGSVEIWDIGPAGA